MTKDSGRKLAHTAGVFAPPISVTSAVMREQACRGFGDFMVCWERKVRGVHLNRGRSFRLRGWLCSCCAAHLFYRMVSPVVTGVLEWVVAGFFSLAYEDLGRVFDNSFHACAFFAFVVVVVVLKWRLARAH